MPPYPMTGDPAWQAFLEAEARVRSMAVGEHRLRVIEVGAGQAERALVAGQRDPGPATEILATLVAGGFSGRDEHRQVFVLFHLLLSPPLIKGIYPAKSVPSFCSTSFTASGGNLHICVACLARQSRLFT